MAGQVLSRLETQTEEQPNKLWELKDEPLPDGNETTPKTASYSPC